MKSPLLLIALIPQLSHYTVAQKKADSAAATKELNGTLEFRPRTEYRNGYRQLRTNASAAAFFTSQRFRFNLNYTTRGFMFHASIQDVRNWGEQDPRSTEGTLQLFEAYAEPSLSKNISVRIGRQRLSYDNERLFSQNDWRQSGNAHDALRMMYRGTHWEADLIGAFNQPHGVENQSFGTNYASGFVTYKVLAANFIKYRVRDKTTLTVLNVVDGYQDSSHFGIHYRFTSGGRAAYETQRFYLTVAAYYQYGKTPLGQKVRAYYIQPEIKVALPPYLTFRLGAEVLRGNDATKSSGISRSFDPLYGANHRFLGAMDYFTNFPNDLNYSGIIAPYFFTLFRLNKKISFQSDEHLFYSGNHAVDDGKRIDRFLAFEHDLLAVYKPNNFTEIQLGYAYARPTDAMAYIKKSGDSQLWQHWAFLMIMFNPDLFRWQK